MQPTLNVNSVARPRALAVDDDAMTRMLHRRYLALCGAEVDEAANGQEAIEAVSAAQAGGRPYNLILMDVQMPVVDGRAAASTVRHNGYTGKLVIVSGSPDLHTPRNCDTYGVHRFLLKPTTPAVLIDTINACLTLARGDLRVDLFGSTVGHAQRLAFAH